MKKISTALFCLALFAHSNAFAFGAIAVDDSVGEKDPAYGISVGEDSEASAKKAALKFCKENGEDCKVVGWFKTCGAYASSTKYFGYGFGATKAVATGKAMEMCGQNSCKLVTAECED